MQLNVYSYSFPFVTPFRSSSQTFKNRKGVIIELKTDGITALGEAAPLPGFSTEGLEQVNKQIRYLKNDIRAKFSEGVTLESLQVFYRNKNIYPSLQFALDTLALDYLSQDAGVDRQDYLFDSCPNHVRINGVVTLSSKKQTLESVKALVNEGFQTVKMKVGLDFPLELVLLKEIRSKYSDLTLRLDANRAWNLDTATENLKKLAAIDPEYCEEPLSNPTPANLKKLVSEMDVPIALDESYLSFQDPGTVMPYLSAIIIKPMVFGGLTKLFATNRLAKHHNNKVIYTTSLESGIGRTMTAILAAGLGDSTSAHGLATGSLLKMDVWHDGTYINNGSFLLPDRVELGKRYKANYEHLDKIQ